MVWGWQIDGTIWAVCAEVLDLECQQALCVAASSNQLQSTMSQEISCCQQPTGKHENHGKKQWKKCSNVQTPSRFYGFGFFNAQRSHPNRRLWERSGNLVEMTPWPAPHPSFRYLWKSVHKQILGRIFFMELVMMMMIYMDLFHIHKKSLNDFEAKWISSPLDRKQQIEVYKHRSDDSDKKHGKPPIHWDLWLHPPFKSMNDIYMIYFNLWQTKTTSFSATVVPSTFV